MKLVRRLFYTLLAAVLTLPMIFVFATGSVWPNLIAEYTPNRSLGALGCIVFLVLEILLGIYFLHYAVRIWEKGNVDENMRSKIC